MEIADASHRPWPLPHDPWVLRQSWNDLLFAHWRVARDQLRELVPRFLELDTFDGEAWVAVTPFRLTDLSPRGLPALPWVSAFNEVNVRTYVVRDGIPGVYFFSLDANSAVAVAGASAVFHLPYHLAEMEFEQDLGRFRLRSARTSGPAQLEVEYGPSGPPFEPSPGTLEYFLTERYCLYTHDSVATPYRVEIHHAPWQLQRAEVSLVVNTMADAARIRLPPAAPLVHFAARQNVLTWRPHVLG